MSNYVEVCSTPLGKYNELPVDLILQAAALLSAKEQLYETQSVKKSHKRPCKVEGYNIALRMGCAVSTVERRNANIQVAISLNIRLVYVSCMVGPSGVIKKPCLAPGCQLAAYRRGLCSRHGGVDKCCVPGCEKNDRGGGYCMAPSDTQVVNVVSDSTDASDASIGSSTGSLTVVACLKPTALPTAINLIKQVIYVTIFKTTHLCTYVHNLLPRRVMTLKSDTVNKDILNIKIYTIHIKCTFFIRHKLSLSIFLLSSVKYIF